MCGPYADSRDRQHQTPKQGWATPRCLTAHIPALEHYSLPKKIGTKMCAHQLLTGLMWKYEKQNVWSVAPQNSLQLPANAWLLVYKCSFKKKKSICIN